MTVVLDRAQMTSASINDLPDSAFAYIEPGGSKDASGKTTPRSKRHFPIHDKAHVQNALARAPQSPFGAKAMPAIKAAAKKFGVTVAGTNSIEPAGELFRSVPFEMATSPAGDGLTLEGYAAVYDSPTRIDSWEGRFDEVIHRGAFARSLARRTPVLMFEHGKHPLIGTMPLGVITRTSEDSKGLYIEARLSDNWLIQPVRDAVRDGGVTGMSFRFEVPEDGEKRTRRAGNVDLRDLYHLDVPELGPVVFPAYEPTTATVRSLVERLPDLAAERQMPPMPGVESDDDPAALAQAACAAMDAAMQAMDPAGMTPEMAAQCAQACALMTAADAALDALLAAMGVPDLPDTGDGRSTDFTGRPTRGVGGGGSGVEPETGAAPAMSSLLRADRDALRLRGIKL